jgi:hypothetical protein
MLDVVPVIDSSSRVFVILRREFGTSASLLKLLRLRLVSVTEGFVSVALGLFVIFSITVLARRSLLLFRPEGMTGGFKFSFSESSEISEILL